jgi:hypothetical protein
MTEGADAGNLASALIQALAAVVEGTISGESLATLFRTTATLIHGAVAGETLAAVLRTTAVLTQGIDAGDTLLSTLGGNLAVAIQDGSETGELFLTALQGIASLAQGGLTGESLISQTILLAQWIDGGALVGETFDPYIRSSHSLSEQVITSDLYLVSHRPAATLLQIALLGDAWSTKLLTGVLLSQGALASDLMSIPRSTDVGLIVATISIAAAVSGTVDLDRHYNE